MKTILLLTYLFFLFIPAQAIHFFNGTYQEALQKAKAENKNLFINFTASWCGPCQLMKRIVFEHPKITQYTDEHYICLSADIEYPEYRILQQRVNPEQAGNIPHICILTPDEKLIKETNSVTTGQMMRFLKSIPQDKPIRNLLATDKIPPLSVKSRLFQQRTSYSSVLEKAKRENKNMVLCFSSHFCGPCRQMEKTTFQNPFILKQVNEQFATGYFEIGDPMDKALCYRYHNTNAGTPFLVLATPDEKIIRTHLGYMDSTSFVHFLQPSGESIDSISPNRVTFIPLHPSIIDKFLYNQEHYTWKLRFTASLNVTTLNTSGTLSNLNFYYRVGYAFGFSLAHEGKHFAIAPGLSFISKGGKNKDITLRQNYLELPVKLTWLYQNKQNGWWKGLSTSPYGSVRIGKKLKNHSGLLTDPHFKTKYFDYGLYLATNMRFSSLDFECGYLLGLANISDYQGGKMYNRGFFLNISLCL